jgi:hypothetical protein
VVLLAGLASMEDDGPEWIDDTLAEVRRRALTQMHRFKALP